MPSITLDISVDTSGIDAFTDNLVAILERIVAKYAFRIEATAKQLAPVHLGLLRASIAAIPNGLEAEIGTAIEYAVYQEFGFHHHGNGAFIQNPFLAPAVAQHAPAFLAEIAAALNGA